MDTPDTDDINAAGEAAWDALAAQGGEDNAATESTATVTQAPESDASAPEDSARAASPAGPAESGGRTRGPDGKFTKSQSATPAPPTEAKTATKPEAQETPAGETAKPKEGATDLTRPPPGLGPLARAKWDATPAEVREDLWRREKETSQALRASAESRQWRENFEKVTAPYAHHFRAAGVDPIAGTQALYDAFGRLSGPDKLVAAQQAVHLIRSYGIPLELMNQALGVEGAEGAASPQAATSVPPAIVQELESMRSQLAALQQQRTMGATQYAQKTLSDFAASHEFYEDVRQDMAKLVSAGYELEEAYEMAVARNPQTREAIRRKQEDAEARRRDEEAQRKRAGAASIRSAPVATPRAAPTNDIYATANAAWDELISRG